MLRSEALVFLPVDKPLNLFRYPATVIDFEILEQALDQSLLVVGINDLEVLGELRLAPVTTQHAVRQPVERADPEVLYGQVQQGLDTMPHLCCGLVRKRDRQQALRGHTLDVDQPGCTMDEHACLAAARARDDERWFRSGCYRLTLSVIKAVEDGCDVHNTRFRKRESVAVLVVPPYANTVLRSVILDADVVRHRFLVPALQKDTQTGLHAV